jgi:peptidoglycan/xylan/chitin deacetylase (PgdA/CDA1 family)
MGSLLSRIKGKYRRTSAERFCRRMGLVGTSVPIISFTFDDAPRSAFSTGGEILKLNGIRATFFVSFGLLGRQTEMGPIATRNDLVNAVKEGHELGCHTFDHLDTWQTTTEKFIESVIRNQKALGRILPSTTFRTFAYPLSQPRPAVKSMLERYFICCRGGGQIPNIGMTDLNLLKAYFLDRRNNLDIEQVKKVIDYNSSRQGWLIFATHDIAENPSPYGCTPEFFREVVEYSARSGALLLTVGETCEKIKTTDSHLAAAI